MPRAATALALLTRYAQLLIFPWQQSSDYSGPVLTAFESLVALRPILGLLLVSAITLLLVTLWLSFFRSQANAAKKSWTPRSLRVALYLTLISAPFAINGNLFFDVGAALAERFLYLPSIGVCGLVAEGLAALLIRSEREAKTARLPAPAVLTGC